MRLLPLLLLAIRIEVPPALACSCEAVEPVEAANASGVAYVGEIVSIEGAETQHEESHGTSVGLFGCGGHEDEEPAPDIEGNDERAVEVRIVEVFLSDVEVGEDLTLTMFLGDQGGDCSILAPEVGDRWIVYGTGEQTISLCSPDGPYVEEDAQALREAFGS